MEQVSQSDDQEQNQASRIYAVMTSLTVLCIIVVAVRFFARSKGRSRLYWDDWIMFLALVYLRLPKHRDA